MVNIIQIFIHINEASTVVHVEEISYDLIIRNKAEIEMVIKINKIKKQIYKSAHILTLVNHKKHLYLPETNAVSATVSITVQLIHESVIEM